MVIPRKNLGTTIRSNTIFAKASKAKPKHPTQNGITTTIEATFRAAVARWRRCQRYKTFTTVEY